MKKLYVIGWPIKHSRSPIIHNHWIKKYDLDADYQKRQVSPDDLDAFMANLKQAECLGFNITIPHKEQVFKQVKGHDKLATKLSACNVISWKNNQLYAYNTDGYGFYKNLVEQTNWVAKDDPVLIYGAGGAARAIILAMKEAGAKNIYIYNRTTSRAKKLLEDLDIRATILSKIELPHCVKTIGLFINTTSLGMNGATEFDIDLSLAPNSAIVADIVYTPLKTGLLKQADKLGLKHTDGLGMLLHQAAKAFEIWFNILPEVDQTLRDLVIDDLRLKGDL